MSEVNQTSEVAEATKPAKKAPAVINRQHILNMLAEGKTREEIGIHYGINKRQTILLFKDSKLKGRKRHFTKNGEPLVSFILEGDVEDKPTKAIKASKEEAKVKEALVVEAPVVEEVAPIVEHHTHHTHAHVAHESVSEVGGW